MEANQNIIHSASFNFQYANAATAAHGNMLIETIFDTHILPQLEQAISNQIPEGLYLELSKLEINIGNISENELKNHLAERIKTALEEALKSKTRIGNQAITGNTDSGHAGLKSIAVYLQKGYFPFGMDHSFSVDELITDAIVHHQNEFISILNQYRGQAEVLQRIVHNLKSETFDRLLQALEPQSVKWIVEFRQMLLATRKDANLNQQSGHDFVRALNYINLRFILNETGSGFDKSKYTRSVVSELRSTYKTDFHFLLQALSKSSNPLSRHVLNRTVNRSVNQVPVPKNLNINELLEILNSGSIRTKTITPDHLKTEISRFIRTDESRKQLVKKLNETGIRTILAIHTNNQADELFELIGALSKVISQSNKAVLLHEIALNATEYLSQNTIREFSPEELTLFLMYSAGSDGSKVINSAAFRRFVQAKEKPDLKKIQSLLGDEARNPEISAIQKILLQNRQSGPADTEIKAVVPNPEDFLIIPKRKIIGFYLRTGRLPDAYSDLSLADIQTIFGELILLKDDFLIKLFDQAEHPEQLTQSLLSMTDRLPAEELKAYFAYHFRKETDILSGVVNQIPSDAPVGSGVISDTPKGIRLLISALAKSKGGRFPDVFLFSLISGLTAETADSGNFFPALLSDSEIPGLAELLNRKNSGTELKKMVVRDYKRLTGKLLFSGVGTNPPDREVLELMQSLSLYFGIDQKFVLDHLQQNTAGLPQVYAAFKTHFNQDRWNLIEKGLLSRPELKRVIEKNANDTRISRKIQLERQQTANWINQLLSHPPLVKPAITDQLLQESLVSINGLLNGFDAASNPTNALAGSFLNHLLQTLKAVGKEEQFYTILKQLKSSGRKELMAMADYWKDQKILVVNASGEDDDEQHSPMDTDFYWTILRFYAINGAFPWWARTISFPELLSGLAQKSRQNPGLFEDTVLRFENEKPILELLVSKAPEPVVQDFGDLFAGHSRLNAIWKQIQQNKKPGLPKNSAKKTLVPKENDRLDDEPGFSKWLDGHPEISDQIREYLSLAPFFYFRNINPAQWRKAVYQFSHGYYGSGPASLNDRFPSDFLNYLKRAHANVDWNESLATVYQLVHSPRSKVNAVFPEALVPLVPIPAKPKTEDQRDVILHPAEEGEAVKIHNSGLILFWPFLTRLFENLSLVKNGDFILPESRNRAVYILQFLAVNAIDFPEHHLVLNKLLAGYQPEEHLVPITSLTEEETESTKSLLNGMIHNWDKMKNTSPEGLQESFIQRDGILKFQNDKITLAVEAKGFDILLQSLPWNISIVKLSWMEKPIYVEWI